jgi:transcriptional regulator with XRE-family HTH domain
LAKKVGVGLYRAVELIAGGALGEDELRKTADWVGKPTDDLVTAPSYPADDESMLRENLNFLLSPPNLRHGDQKALAKALGVANPQVTRWKSGTNLPHPSNIDALLRHFGLDPRIDLKRTPLFLANHPIHGEAKRDYLMNLLKDAPFETLDDHFDSIRKLLDE